MKDLAVVLITCDKYSWLWDAWHYHFRNNWRIDCPVYFCNEVQPIEYKGITQITCGYVEPNANKWTKQVRECVEQIPEQHLFVILEDLLFDQDITDIFNDLYTSLSYFSADALRIRSKPTKASMTKHAVTIKDRELNLLTDRSNYLITFSANLWDKDYLMKCLSKDQSPWKAERSNRMKGCGHRVFDFSLPGWYINALVLGKLTDEGQRKIYEYKLSS